MFELSIIVPWNLLYGDSYLYNEQQLAQIFPGDIRFPEER